jgi:hypothetical protein
MNEYVASLTVISSIVVGLFIWLNTDGFLEWARFFKIHVWKYNEYLTMKKGAMSQFVPTYSSFLLFKNPENFWIKLFTCSICSGAFFNLIAFSILSLFYFPILLLLPWAIISTWIFYKGISALLNE